LEVHSTQTQATHDEETRAAQCAEDKVNVTTAKPIYEEKCQKGAETTNRIGYQCKFVWIDGSKRLDEDCSVRGGECLTGQLVEGLDEDDDNGAALYFLC
jgi:hypothetical protein